MLFARFYFSNPIRIIKCWVFFGFFLWLYWREHAQKHFQSTSLSLSPLLLSPLVWHVIITQWCNPYFRNCTLHFGRTSRIQSCVWNLLHGLVSFRWPYLDQWIHSCLSANGDCWGSGYLLFQQVSSELPLDSFGDISAFTFNHFPGKIVLIRL